MPHKPYSKSAIKKILKSPSPRVLLNVCTHGDERVGLKAVKYFSKKKISRGTLMMNIANEKAVKAGTRYIDADLNRVFPGKLKGNHEEKLAHTLAPFVAAFDLVIDVHSTKTGVDSTLILNDFDESIVPLVRAVSPKRALIMTATKSSSLISVARSAIAFEYGKDGDASTFRGTVEGIEKILEHLDMLPKRFGKNKKSKKGPKKKPKNRTAYFNAYRAVEKPPGFVVSPSIRNFKLVKKGQLIGTNPASGEKIHSGYDFYPILFGNNTYKTIFGFAAKKVS